jgi:ribosomal protein S12 methylthiotransferase accessory factor
LAQFEMTKRLSRASGREPHPLSFLSVLAGLSTDAVPFLKPCNSKPATPAFQTTPEALRDKLIAQGITPFVVNLSTSETAVVRVIAPGLRPIWPRFAAGRLYDVPVALKLKLEKTPQSAMNPLPILY